MPSEFDQNHIYYQQYFRFPGKSQWMEKIWSEVFGANYPKGLDPFGYVTEHDLNSITSSLDLSPGDSLLDIGCGKGGPGLKVAEQLQLNLTGVDIIPEAIDRANELKNSFLLAHPAQFKVGEFYEIPLEPQSVDGVMSIDALWTVPDKIEALRHVKRVMKPGAKFLFTHWDLLSVDPVPYLEQSGLTFIAREETPHWKTYQQQVYAKIAEYQDEIWEELGEASNMLLYEAANAPAHLDLSIRRLYHFELK